MSVAMLQQVYARLQQRPQLGIEGMVGLGLCVLGVAFYLSVVSPLQTRWDELTARATPAALHGKATALREDRDPGEQLAEFYKFFPPAASAPEWLAKIYAAARAQQLNLSQGEYRMGHDKTGRLLRYQITLPVKGNYGQLRRFLAAVLTEVPIASLDNIGFERQKISDTAITAHVKLTLYLVEP